MGKCNSYKTALTLVVILTIGGIILFALSVKVISLNEIGIIQNVFNKKIDTTKIYKSGRYLIGMTNR